MTEQRSRCWTWNVVLLGIILLVGMALRLYYAARANLYIDEFTTIWAAQRVLAEGLPRFPLGAIYTQGLLYTYLDAGVLLLGGGYHPFLARLPSLILAAVTLALTAFAARRLFHVLPVGLATLWLALDGEAIIWSGRARTYALLQLLVLLAFLAWYRGAVADDRPGPRWLAIGLLSVALVDQQVILLLLPPLAILALVARGWGWLRQPVVWLQAGVMLLALAARWLLYRLMILPGSTATATPRAFVDLFHPFAEWKALAPFLTDPNRLVAALLLAGGVVWLLLWRRRQTPAPRQRTSGSPQGAPWRKPVLSITFVLVLVMLEMLLLVGTTWRRPRYFYPLLPLLYVGAEGVAVPALRGLARRLARGLSFLTFRRALTGLTIVFVILVAGLAFPSARAAAMRNEWGYDRALDVVSEGWAKGDALATYAPAAAFVLLGDCDYLAVEEEGQALVVEREGRRLDSWTGLPLLDSPAHLVEALETHPRLWFVVDEMRLDRHFSPEYLSLLWDRFDLEAFEWGTFVFRSRPDEATPKIEQPLDAELGGQLHLTGYAVSDSKLEPGQTVTVTLRWAPITPEGNYVATVRLVNREGEAVATHEAPPLDGLYPVDRWAWSPDSQPFPDRHSLILPTDLAPGRYRLEAGLHRPGTGEPVGEAVTLDFLSVGGVVDAAEPPVQAPMARFGDVVTLVSHELAGEVAPGSAATLRLQWQTGPSGFDADYTVFVHLLDGDGQIAQQWDAPPVGGWYPTSYWDPDEVVVDDYDLAFDPELTPGNYRFVLGLYRTDGTRLSLDDGTDSVEVAAMELGN